MVTELSLSLPIDELQSTELLNYSNQGHIYGDGWAGNEEVVSTTTQQTSTPLMMPC